ncbi:hypothetical protein BGZ81_001137 [Podila clonocystis]|nr:hypothetical protein BGZ81_001137 [Podila clonocystis]
MPKKNRKREDTEESNGTGENGNMIESSSQEVGRKNKKRFLPSESQDSDADDSRGSTNDSDPECQDDPKKLKKEKKSKKDKKVKKEKKEKKDKKEKRLKREHNYSVNDDSFQDSVSKMSLPTPPPTSSLSFSSAQSPTLSSTTNASGATTPLVAAVRFLTMSSSAKPTLPQSTSKTPAMLPRTVLASRMLPRQVSRPIPVTSASQPATLIPPQHSPQREIHKVFRAKDIIAHYHNQSQKEAAATSSTSSTSTSTSTPTSRTFTSNPISTAPKEITSEMLKSAEPIVVFPAGVQRGKHGEYLFGNYPHYYVKRASEQKRGRRDRKKKAQGEEGDEEKKEDRGVEGREEDMSESRGDKSITTTKTTRRRIYPQEKIAVTGATTPSVLLPCTGYKHTHGHATVTSVQDLARHVDLRLEFLEPSWFYKKQVLDIGCNAALLTVFIALHYQPRKIQGVDIDPSLIAKAQKFVRNTFSQLSSQAYTQKKKTETAPSSSLSSSSLSSGSTSGPIIPYEAYFPKSMSYLHGLLPVPPKTADTELLFPHNIEFRIADWMASDPQDSEGEAMWDVIIGFSLTKWIHLHHGDKGLQGFFHKVYKSLAPGGVFLVEPQAFVTYNKRSKITPTMRENYMAIKMKPEMFEEYLLQTVGFKESRLLGHSEGAAKNFNRDIYMFRK